MTHRVRDAGTCARIIGDDRGLSPRAGDRLLEGGQSHVGKLRVGLVFVFLYIQSKRFGRIVLEKVYTFFQRHLACSGST